MSILASDFYTNIGMRKYAARTPFSKIGYTPTMTTTDSDIWSAAGAYVFPVGAAQWRIAAGNANDLGTVIKGNAEGANQTILCDATGNTTTLVDADVNFASAVAVAVGDCVLLSPKGDGSTAALTPEWGYVTSVANAATGTLVIGGGFSSGGTCAAARAYSIVSKATTTGAQVVKIDYLTSAYASKTILVALNGGTAVSIAGSGGAALTETFRVNSFRIVAAGSGAKAAAAISLQLNAAPNTVYSYITAGFTRARNSAYTVPTGKTIYITEVNAGFGETAKAAVTDYARMYLRTNREPTTDFLTGDIFYGVTEVITFCNTMLLTLPIPLKIIATTDVKMSGLSSTSGFAVSTIRGWIE